MIQNIPRAPSIETIPTSGLRYVNMTYFGLFGAPGYVIICIMIQQFVTVILLQTMQIFT